MKPFLIAAFVALCAADAALTNHVLASGGWEANPLMAHAQAALGAWWWIPKLIVTLAAVAFMSRWRVAWITPWVAFMGLVVVNNALQ